MNQQLKKIIVSLSALLLSFVIKIELVSNILLGLSIVVLLENNCVEAYKKIKEKDFFNEYVFIAISSIIFILTNHLVLLLEALLFFSVKDYMYLKLMKEKDASYLKPLDKKEEFVTLKVASGFIQVPLKEVKVGDVIYLEKESINYIEGSLASKETTYHTLCSDKNIVAYAKDNIPSGTVILEPCYLKAKRTYETSTLNIAKKILQTKSKEEKEVEKVEKRFEYFLFLFVVLYFVIEVAYNKADIAKTFTTAASLIFLVASSTIMKYETHFTFQTLYGFFKKDIYFVKENLLEKLNEIKIIVFSKEGVVTTGKLNLSKVIPVYQTKEEILEKAVYAEYGSTHPVARALTSYYPIDIMSEKIEYTEDIAGGGRRAIIAGEEIYLGNQALFDALEISYPKIEFLGPSIMIAINRTYAGTFVFTNNELETSYMTVPLLRGEGIEKVILISSGEKEQIKKLGGHLSMSESYASLTPKEKEQILSMYQKEAKTLYMDASSMDKNLRKCVEVSVLLGSDNMENEADILISNEDPTAILTIIKEVRKLAKKRQILKLVFLLIKLFFFALLLFKLTNIVITTFLYLLIFFLYVFYDTVTP